MFDHIQAFHRPRDIQEAIRLIQDGGGGGRFLAGGTDLAVQADRSVRFLVDISKLGLNYIRPSGSGWVIGATATMAELEKSPAIRALANGILANAAASCGSVQNRNVATLGGNLMNASPAADTATPLLALDAAVTFADARGQRTVALVGFFTGPHRTAAGGALLLEVEVPAPPAGARLGWSFQKLGRTQSDISLVNAAAGLGVEPDHRVKWVRIALGAVAPTPMRAANAEKLLAGRKLEPGIIDKAAAEVVREVRPISDVRASADYRWQMSGVLVKRALRECARQVGCAL
jgi:carbon-monoxide dehydrogenase medium subunit